MVASKQKQTTLAVLFGGQKSTHRHCPLPRLSQINAELVLMEALGEAEEDKQLDDREKLI